MADFKVSFSCDTEDYNVSFGEVYNISDGGYERGYEAGYDNGLVKGYADGLAARTFEVWTLTLVDGTTVEKEVALL